MLDWKILVAAFAALLIASTVLVGGAGGFGLTDIFNKIGEWLKSSPFGGFFQTPVASIHEVDVALKPKTYTLKTSSNINLSIDSINFVDFNGNIEADFQGKTLVFTEANTPLNIKMPLQNITIHDIRVDKIFLDETDFSVSSNQLETTGENGTIEIFDFYGEIRFSPDSVELHGNVSMVRGNNKDIV
ncbi:MAG: hypothetical protein JSW41_04515 [Candidatus Aenigmatarchaeota archaeon]|nr:MAG: hypothetical protein JSW41_04515 [Candidatus Aenigmarchaeota archaeon]